MSNFLGYRRHEIPPLPPLGSPEQSLDEFAELLGCHICDRHDMAHRLPARRDFRDGDVEAIELRWPGTAETAVVLTIRLDGVIEVPITADSPAMLRLRDTTEADWFINRLTENLVGLREV